VRSVGLTGGIGAGKSAVSRLLAAHGAAVIDADAIAREVVALGTPGLAAVAEAFGPGVLLPDGSLDREALGKVVFADPEALARLNAIVHPLVGAEMAARIAAQPDGAVVVHDVPLLVENGLAAGYDLVVVVEAPLEIRLDRLVRLRGMAEEDARARIGAQATDEQRRRAAGVLIRNDGTLDDLRRAVDEAWPRIAGLAPD
jgi:dephospho-CoA kinase